MAYFLYIGLTLSRRQEKEDSYDEWLRFKKRASLIINADGLTLFLVMVFSATSLQLPASFKWTFAIGTILSVVGVGVKLAAYRVVGAKGYYWYNFFCDGDEREYAARGVYKYMDNPMYTLGYLHAFGLALIFRSLWGLAFSLFDWAVIWAFYYYFESQHTRFHREQVTSFSSRHFEVDSLSQEN